jgi:hypothetical protein
MSKKIENELESLAHSVAALTEVVHGFVSDQRRELLQVGEAYLVRTITHYFIGKLTEITPYTLKLENVAWIGQIGGDSETGRWDYLLKNGVPSGGRYEVYDAPEYISRLAVIDCAEWNHKIPSKSVG